MISVFLIGGYLIPHKLSLINHSINKDLTKKPGKSKKSFGTPLLLQKIAIPKELLTRDEGLQFGGDIRIGDLTGDGRADFLVYRVARGNSQGATKPCFLGAFNMDGEILWQKGKNGIQPYRPGPVAIYDIDGDEDTEVICFFYENQNDQDPFSLQGITVQILNGRNGKVEKQTQPNKILTSKGKGPNWVHQRILVANFTGRESPQEFVIKLGKNVLALDHQLNVLWSYSNPWDEYGYCPAYIPAVGDIDNDGRDEVNGGYYLLDYNGSVMWEKKWGRHMDAVAIAEWDGGKMLAFCSGYGHIVDKKGNIILQLGKNIVPHGQELRVADFKENNPGPEMIICHKGHNRDVILVGNKGNILEYFKLNASPNNTGMTAVYWHGEDQPALLYNGGVLWEGSGAQFAELPKLPEPIGD